MQDLAAPNPQLAICVPCGFYQWLRKPDTPNCPLCEKPPTHIINSTPFSWPALAQSATLPIAPAPGDDEPLVFTDKCVHCGAQLVIELTATSLTVRAPDAPPAGDVSSDEPTPLAEPTDAPPVSTDNEGGGSATPPAAPPPSASPEPAPATS
jgi:hypothetical protein